MTGEEWKALVREAAAKGLPGAEEALFQIALADAVETAAPAGGEEGARGESAAQALVQAENGIAGQEVGLTAGAAASSAPDPTVEEDEMEVIGDDTTEGRAQRYIERKQGTRLAQPRGQRRVPTLRAWDDPSDLQWQDVGSEQDEKESGPLQQNDGSISINAG